MEKKNRIFYLDFIRVISMIMIVTYHFFAHFTENNIVGAKIFSNGKWGLIGVTLFFMISGASLMYNYGEKLEIKSYIKKRFLGLYPMFWIAYIFVFIYVFYQAKRLTWTISIYKIFFSFFAMDGYLSEFTPTFYLIGEWFLGCIICIYILFPILRKLMLKFPKTLIVIATLLNFAVLLFHKNWILTINKNIIVCAYSFLLGMYIIKYIKEFKIWYAILPLILSIALYFVKANTMNMIVLLTNLVGYNLFIVLSCLGTKLKNLNILKNIFNVLSKYSYAIFLVHHFIIMKIESTFQYANLRIFEVICLYITCWLVIGIFAKLLYYINNSVLNFIKKDNKKIENREQKEIL